MKKWRRILSTHCHRRNMLNFGQMRLGTHRTEPTGSTHVVAAIHECHEPVLKAQLFLYHILIVLFSTRSHEVLSECIRRFSFSTS